MNLTGLFSTPFTTHFFITSSFYDGLVCIVSDNRHALLLKRLKENKATYAF
jgi:hypothetical protein